MIDNSHLLEKLIDERKIRLKKNEITTQHPTMLPENFCFDKVEGMLLGLAIGDALGATSEGKQAAERRDLYGEIRDYLPGKRSNYKAIGSATDDTQLSFWTLEQLIDDNGLDPDNLARKFCKHHIIGIGRTVKTFIRNYKDKHIPWYKAGSDSLGNGALMRISPVILPYLRNPHCSMYADVALDSMISHNSFASNASCIAFIKMLWDLLGMTSPPKPEWWLDTYCSVAKELEGDSLYKPSYRQYADFEGPLWKFTHNVCSEALQRQLTVEKACNQWGSGANLFETIPSVLYILTNHGHNAEEAIIRAVNDTVDNDTIASIVGAAVGALHGLAGIPERWVKRLQGRIREGGGSQVFRLILHSKQIFWLQANI
jgi:ADP-ribosyl-[dinitrogen reductase] hydrolase